MRDPKRIPAILEAIREVWELHPDQRLGQLVHNVFSRFRNGNWLSGEDLAAFRLLDDDVWLMLLTVEKEKEISPVVVDKIMPILDRNRE